MSPLHTTSPSTPFTPVSDYHGGHVSIPMETLQALLGGVTSQPAVMQRQLFLRRPLQQMILGGEQGRQTSTAASSSVVVPLSSVGDRSVTGDGCQDGGQLLSGDTKLRCIVVR